MRVAVVHDWLYVLGGAERVLQEILRCYPQADVFALFDILTPEDRAKSGIAAAHTSFLQHMPFISKWHRSYLPLMPIAIEQFDLSAYDLVISSSYAVAKGVLTGPDQLHISYVHSPMRYAWDLQHSYLADTGNTRGLKSVLIRVLLHKMRIWDTRTAHGPDVLLANSAFISRRIRKVYGRQAQVLYPPVELSTRRIDDLPTAGHFLAASRLVPYKNVDAIVQAFNRMPDLKLIVAGDGPEAAKLKKMAGKNIIFKGFVSDEELRQLMATARAFVFAAEEDFGIISVEAQSEGTPVLALGRGGSRETVVERRTGLFFDHPTADEISKCVRTFVEMEHLFSRDACRNQAARFSAERFRADFRAIVEAEIEAHTVAANAYAPPLELVDQAPARVS